MKQTQTEKDIERIQLRGFYDGLLAGQGLAPTLQSVIQDAGPFADGFRQGLVAGESNSESRLKPYVKPVS